MALIDDIKLVLRITHTALDGEVTDLINAAKSDLKLNGIKSNIVTTATDELIKRAITIYVKAYFGWDNPDKEGLIKSYEMLRTHMSASVDYVHYTINFDIGVRGSVELDGIEKDTNSLGVVSFFVSSKNNVTYIAKAEGYITQTEIIDIEVDETITLVMVSL